MEKFDAIGELQLLAAAYGWICVTGSSDYANAELTLKVLDTKLEEDQRVLWIDETTNPTRGIAGVLESIPYTLSINLLSKLDLGGATISNLDETITQKRDRRIKDIYQELDTVINQFICANQLLSNGESLRPVYNIFDTNLDGVSGIYNIVQSKFEDSAPVELTLSSGSGGSAISSVGGEGVHEVAKYTNIGLCAEAETNFRFLNWLKDNVIYSTIRVLSETIIKSVEYVAQFIAQQTLRMNAVINGTITPITGDHLKDVDSLVDVLPIPDSGYETFITADGLFFDYSAQLLMNESKVVNPINVLNPPLSNLSTLLDKTFDVNLFPFAGVNNANVIGEKLVIVGNGSTANWAYYDWRLVTNPGDRIKVTLYGINYISGSGCKLILNEGNDDTSGVVNEIVGIGTVVFDNLIVPNSPNDSFIILGSITGSAYEINIDGILIELYEPKIELYDGIYANSISLDGEPSTNSEYNFIYTDTDLSVSLTRGDSNSYFDYSSLFVNGVFVQKIQYVFPEVLQDIILPETGYVTIKTNAQTKPAATANSLCYIKSIFGNGNAYTKVNEGNIFNKNVLLGDSITVGDHATNVNLLSFAGKLALDRATVILGYGYGTLQDFAGNSTVLADTVSKYSEAFANCLDKKYVLIALGTNDFGLNSTPATTFKGWYEDLVQALKTDDSEYKIFCLSPLLRGDETSLLEDYRTAISEVCISEETTYIDGSLVMPNNTTYFDVDLVHPNDNGHETIYNYIYPIIE